jgi:hypothetical protein
MFCKIHQEQAYKNNIFRQQKIKLTRDREIKQYLQMLMANKDALK